MSEIPRPSIISVSVALMSAVISACALWVSIQQADLAREHNRLSVRPQLDWRIDDAPDGSLTVSLINVGLGPASVNDVHIIYLGRPLGLAGEEACSELDRQLNRSPEQWTHECFTVGDSAAAQMFIRSDEHIDLYHSTPRRPGALGATMPQPGNFAIRAHYCSMYDQCFVLSD